MSKALFKKNIQAIGPSMTSDGNTLSLDFSTLRTAARHRVNSCREREVNDWSSSSDKIINLTRYIPRNKNNYNSFKQHCIDFESPSTASKITKYIDSHDDFHIYKSACSIYELIERCGIDPDDATIKLGGYNPTLVFFGTGNGHLINELIKKHNPTNLFVFVSDWSEFLSSAWFVDWAKIGQEYQENSNKNIVIKRVKNFDECVFSLASINPLLLDCAYMFLFKNSCGSLLHEFPQKLSNNEILKNMVSYLGYTVDEYNMIYNTASTLTSSVKLYSKTHLQLAKQVVVVASGPSLDKNLDQLRILSQSALIIAAGSSIKTLITNNIRVDVLCLVERAEEVYDDFIDLSNQYDLSNVRLVFSSTCTSRLIDIFPDAMVYFRPALTPISIFCDDQKSVLSYEGPESINCAFSFAISLNPDNICLFGVDLGTVDPNNDRSKTAAGSSSRSWDLTYRGNFDEEVFTNKIQTDARIVIENCIANHTMPNTVYNFSGGVYIKNTVAASTIPDKLLHACHKESDIDLFYKWWKRQPKVKSSIVRDLWKVRNPRQQLYETKTSLKYFLQQKTPLYPNLLDQVNSLMSISLKPYSEQFGARIFRGTIVKLFLMICYQFQVMRDENSETLNKFDKSARQIVESMVDLITEESFELCDKVDELLESES